MTSKLARTSSKAVRIEDAFGKAHILAVGVSDYSKGSNFGRLAQCSNDAAAVKACFAAVFQLHGDPSKLHLITSKGDEKPTRGAIIGALKGLAQEAGRDDRIVFYFSGHGQRLDSKLYLVPGDAYADDDPQALVHYDQVLQILESSAAKQKIIFLDACSSGPLTHHTKMHAASITPKFLAEYVQKTSGIAVLASSLSDQASSVKSPNPQLSLFTHFLVEGLHGRREALDGSLLTISSLYGYVSAEVQRVSKSHNSPQQPTVEVKAGGEIVLGDFHAILNPDSLEVDKYPIETIDFVDRERLRVQSVLTNIQRWTYTQEHLARRVNDTLGTHFEEDLGRKAARLRNDLGFGSDTVGVEGSSISFPDGTYWMEYVSEDKKSGRLLHHATFEHGWFGRYDDVVRILTALDMQPTEVVLQLANEVSPQQLVPGLEAQGWILTSTLGHKIEAEQQGYEVVVEEGELRFRGFSPSELLGKDADRTKAGLAAGVLTLLGTG